MSASSNKDAEEAFDLRHHSQHAQHWSLDSVRSTRLWESASFLVHFLLGNAGSGMRKFHPMSL